MNKKTVLVIFGGRSSEHEVSCISASNIISNINQDIYETIIIGITKEGKWLRVESAEEITSGKWIKSKVTAILSPDATQKGILIMDGKKTEVLSVDVVFPVLHGRNGEDGTIQGLLELSNLPYVGCGVLSSAITMDKLYTKIIVDTLHIRQAAYVPVRRSELSDINLVADRVEKKLSYPVFIKPSNAGSSKGISKAHDRGELIEGLKFAAEHDRKILVEETIVGREIECAVLGGIEVKASGVGEILAGADFYDYDAKYNNPQSQTVLTPEFPEGVEKEVRESAINIFKAVDGYGLSRVDFFLEKGTNQVVFNEINTIPGFTGISMYPMLWETKGIGKMPLIDKLLQLAMDRYK